MAQSETTENGSATTTELYPEKPQPPDDRTALDKVLSETERRRSVAQTAAELVGVNTPQQLYSMLRMLWRQKDKADFTDAELYHAVSLIARYDLDPLVKEVYCSRDKRGRVMVIVGIDGWIKILHRTEGYDGHETAVVWSDTNGIPESATTTVYSKLRRHPISYVAYWKEYAAVGGFVKDQMPSHMLRLFSLRHAARQFAPIGGNVLTEAEARYMEQCDELPQRQQQNSEDVLTLDTPTVVTEKEVPHHDNIDPSDILADLTDAAAKSQTLEALNGVLCEVEQAVQLGDITLEQGKVIRQVAALTEKRLATAAKSGELFQ